ncbi:unnamed protein product [Linum tenue]|uniref:Choline monooxygenase, chloroplastic n=1 Tax=Linum tenue TaxID=586396 RepID=A0AAV0QHS6_9ROSI|nr:unnamed protein product [Linum tenue]
MAAMIGSGQTIKTGLQPTLSHQRGHCRFYQTPISTLTTENWRRRRSITVASCSLHHNSENSLKSHCEKLVHEFDPEVPIEKALTPPSSWYTDASFYDFELDRVFYRGWQAVGYTEQIKEPRDFFTGRLGTVEFVVCRDEKGKVQAFHNVCRHHASILASGSGQKTCFVCPYHGWTYGLDGALRKATRITGIQNFNVNEFGLIAIDVAVWGPFVLLNLERKMSPDYDVGDNDLVENEWLGSTSELLKCGGVDTSLSYLFRREYTIDCNWKVLASISSTISRYGPWMDTNLVVPLGPRKCQVIFDYFIEPHLKDDKSFIEQSLIDSEKVQMEDIILCDGVQRGLESPAYCSGRYAPTVENAMYHFHQLLHSNLCM